MKRLPIRIRLTVWYLVVFTVALCAFGLSVWTLVRQRLYSEVSEQLASRVSSVEHYMAAQGVNPSVEHMRGELKEEYDSEDEGVWLQIVDQDGEWMYRSQGMQGAFPTVTLPQKAAAHGKLWSAKVGHNHLRVLEKPVTVSDRMYTIQTAVVTNGVRRTLHNLRTVFFLLAPAFILIAAFGSYYMSRRALATVDEITAMARSINDRNLDSRLPALKTNDELQRLSDTLNQMLTRIEGSFKRTRQFTADASHELRTPVSLIRTEAELALRKSRSEEEYRNALSHIHTESVRTSELIESLLTLARADSGADVLQLRSLRYMEFLREVAIEWEPMFAAAGLKFESSLLPNEVLVNADEATLRRLLIILLDNARKNTPESGKVILRAQRENGRVTVSIEDTGVGIEARDLPRIFDRFYRVDKVRSRSVGGVGLGLSLAKWIADQHHTKIAVVSTPGKGSVFSFSLDTSSDDSQSMRPSQLGTDERAERVV
jgi:heavy metal sensor kinase